VTKTPVSDPAPGDRPYWRLRPFAPHPGTALGPLDSFPDNDARAFSFGAGRNAFSMFVVRKGNDLFGYLNICPHYSLPLNGVDETFLNPEKTRIRCVRHFAEFDIENGACVRGAAVNTSLDAIPLDVVDGEVRISE